MIELCEDLSESVQGWEQNRDLDSSAKKWSFSNPPRINFNCEKPFILQAKAWFVEGPVVFHDAYYLDQRIVDDSDSLEQEFDELVATWKRETMVHSSFSRIVGHPAYIRIIGMGKEGIPFVLKELQKSPAPWFYALKFMAGIDVSRGVENFEEAREKWLSWGNQKRYI